MLRLYSLLRAHQAKGTATHTFGALDPVQVVQMAKHLETVYVSGWQCSSTASTTNEPGPDVADYTYDTVQKQKNQKKNQNDFSKNAFGFLNFLYFYLGSQQGEAAFQGPTNARPSPTRIPHAPNRRMAY